MYSTNIRASFLIFQISIYSLVVGMQKSERSEKTNLKIEYELTNCIILKNYLSNIS